MTLENHFPTLGEIANYLFQACGVLPSKGDKENLLRETEKKTFQRKLNRLSKEEGSLSQSLAEVLDILRDYVETVFPDQKVVLAIADSIFDALNQYQDLVRGDGSHLVKKETVRWLLSYRLPHRAVLSTRKNSLKYHVKALELCCPEDKYWFLPSIKDAEIQWPLTKVMLWIYELLETSQTHFHYPGCSTETDDSRLAQNLENASRWINGRQMPSWSSLKLNLESSFDALAICEDPKFRKNLSEKLQANIRLIVFISRTTTFIFRDIEKHYGRDFLSRVVALYKKYDRQFDEEERNIERFVQEIRRESPDSNDPAYENGIWLNAVPMYFQVRSTQAFKAGQEMAKLQQDEIKKNEKILSRQDVKSYFEKKYGVFYVSSIFDELEKDVLENLHSVPFMEAVLHGMALRSKSDLSENEVKAYEERLAKNSLTEAIPWLVPWMRATYLYRQEKHSEAFEQYKEAFEKGRYSAGKNQYLLVNQYIEACAKVNNYKAFKKGVSWANYLGIEVRWLRGSENPESEDTLRAVFGMFQYTNYPQL